MSADYYARLFADASRAGVHRLPHGAIDDLVAGAGAAGCLLLRIDLSTARNKEQLLSTLGEALRFPEWFGHNWDALSDCLLDMGWLPATGYVIVLDHCDRIHRLAENDLAVLMQIFRQAAATWREDGIPFWCLVDLQADIAELPAMPQAGQ